MLSNGASTASEECSFRQITAARYVRVWRFFSRSQWQA
jgi:hypothetical protein